MYAGNFGENINVLHVLKCFLTFNNEQIFESKITYLVVWILRCRIFFCVSFLNSYSESSFSCPRTLHASADSTHSSDPVRAVPTKGYPVMFITRDGASNLKKASAILKVDSFQHCIAHSLHLLLTTDDMDKVPTISALIRKCKSIVTTLHFKGCKKRNLGKRIL